MKILVTGAAGQVGTKLYHDLAKDHELRLLDVNPIDFPQAETMRGSVTDWPTVQRAVKGMDAVAHLAIHHPINVERQPYHQYIQDDVDIGIKGTDMLLHAAQENGVRRFVYTASINSHNKRLPDTGQMLHTEDEQLSNEHYGTIKWLAEELCRHYALVVGLSTVVVRFNSVTFPRQWHETLHKDYKSSDYPASRVHVEDAVRAVRMALEKKDVQWARCIISGANVSKLYDTESAEKLIGFRARYGFDTGKMFKDGKLIHDLSQ